jgi:hypothetical protein
MPAEARHISVTIDRDWRAVYDYACVPLHFPEWASGLGSGLRRDSEVADETFIVAAPEGQARVRFSPRNAYGVLDHWVTLQNGHTVYIPLRVIANGDGAEVTLSLIRQPQMSDADFARDADWVLRDLRRLKALIENDADAVS